MSELRLSNITKSFGEIDIIKGVDLIVNDGEFVVFVGPSGCGKSTLLRMIAGLEDVTDGIIQIGNQVVNHVDAAKRGIAMVFQSYALYPHKTVRSNMEFGLKMSGIPKDETQRRITHAAEILQLDHLLDRKPKQLSGGQRQRVAIGRAIVREPGIFLFDEPLSNLDAELRVEMRVQLTRLHRRLSATMIYVTHDQVEAMTMADRIVVLRDGLIEQVGTPMELYNNPANMFVAGFLGAPKMNFLPAQIERLGATGTQVITSSGMQLDLPLQHNAASIGDDVTIGIRPSDVQCEGDRKHGSMTVDVSEYLGGLTLAYGSFENHQIIVEMDKGRPVKYNDTLPLTFPTEKCHLFNRDGFSFSGRTN